MLLKSPRSSSFISYTDVDWIGTNHLVLKDWTVLGPLCKYCPIMEFCKLNCILIRNRTGATDGIGRCFAEDLSRRGFNVIIHGRNEQKLETLKRDLEQQYPKRQFRTLRIDAGKEMHDSTVFERAVDELRDVNLRILINNVGGSSGLISFMPLQERPSDQVRTIMDVNARFPIEITKALLPQLRKNQPGLILNCGSTSSEFGIPYLSIYAGCKAANRAWSRSLTAEMKAEGVDIEVFCVWISAVATSLVPRDASFSVPSARAMANSCLNKVGCGRSLVFGYWPHEIQAMFFWALPTWIQERLMIDVGKRERVDDLERFRKKT